ncbi:hypothetical protein, partial [Dethiosulfatarculus sandiegensis]|uniref:hypothetical protein n=1 Tax=Dethiosulfatarculus sandiegensis TaxID=1429043 RepID=UPI001E4A104C
KIGGRSSFAAMLWPGRAKARSEARQMAIPSKKIETLHLYLSLFIPDQLSNSISLGRQVF